jgi:hypothetical protein
VKRLLVLGMLCSGSVFGQTVPLSTADVTGAIAKAGREIVAYLPYAEQLDVSDALRVAALRGKRVFFITSVKGVQDPMGFTLRLAHVPGVRTYLAAPTGEPFLIIDGSLTLSGNGLMQDGLGTKINVARPERLLAWAQSVTKIPPANKVALLKLRYSGPPHR